MLTQKGTLYIVSTPIGNLKDITFRAVEILKSVSLIAAEDTRRTKILLDHYGIQTPATSYYEYNKIRKADYLLRVLQEGRDVAMVSDAGTPGISDPGYNIISLAIDNSIPVVAIPGACALIAALAVSGKPTNKFLYEGFLPIKPIKRINRLRELKELNITIVLYESPHRLVKTLNDILSVFGDVEIALSRELTKKFEEIRRDKTADLIEHFTTHKPLGEFTLVI